MADRHPPGFTSAVMIALAFCACDVPRVDGRAGDPTADVRVLSVGQITATLADDVLQANVRHQDGDITRFTVRTTDVQRGERVARSELHERFDTTSSGIEQSWQFDREPSGTGDLVVAVDWNGPRFTHVDDEGLHFRDGARTGLRYGHATWVDARNARSAIRVSYASGRILIRVPHATLRQSAFPAVLDPVIGIDHDLDSPIWGESYTRGQDPALSFDGTTYLAVWQDDRGPAHLHGARLLPTGEMLDPYGIHVVPRDGDLGLDELPQIAAGAGGWLVAYQHRIDSASDSVDATLVASDGSVSARFEIAATERRPVLDVASDGTDYMVVFSSLGVLARRVEADGSMPMPPVLIDGSAWEPAIAYGSSLYLMVWFHPTGVYGTRLTLAGAPMDVPRIALAAAVPGAAVRQPAVAAGADSFLVVWSEIVTGSTVGRIRGVVVSAAGVAGTPFPISPDETGILWPAVGFDGESFLVSWFSAATPSGRLMATRVSSAGVVLTPEPVVIDPECRLFAAPNVERNTSDTWVGFSDQNEAAAVRIPPGLPIAAERVALAGGANWQDQVQIAAGEGQYLVSWTDWRNRGSSSSDVFAVRVNPSGEPIGDVIGLATSPDQEAAGGIAFDGTDFLATWARSTDGLLQVHGARVSADGRMLDSGDGALVPSSSPQVTPVVSHDGDSWLLAWSTSGPSRVLATRLDAGLRALDGSGITLAMTYAENRLLAAAVPGTHLVAWTQGFDDTFGARFRAGASLGSTSITTGVIAGLAAGTSQFALSVYRDGVSDSTMAGAIIDAETGARARFELTERVDGNPLRPGGLAFDGAAFLAVYRHGLRGGPVVEGFQVGVDGVVVEPSPFVVTAPLADLGWPRLASLGDGVSLLAYSAYVAGDPYEANRARVRSIGGDPLPLGARCVDAASCLSGFCVDGVCCESACGGGEAGDCLACAVAAGARADGSCDTLGATVICRASRGPCDVSEACDGASAGCAPDVAAEDGTACADGTVCNGSETCAAGACVADSPLDCDDGDSCTLDGCDPESGCTHDDACDDAGPPPDMGPADAGRVDAGPRDAGPADAGPPAPPDSGPVDAGPARRPAQGCGCAAGDGDADGIPRSILLVSCIAWALLRRRRPRSG
ncbi:MAG: hypothetical protein IT379_03280 [Deltaproteobacteria bacterium]|nr:hypothetical protein [Deltaproteobacteria bacterium]